MYILSTLNVLNQAVPKLCVKEKNTDVLSRM